MLAMRSLVEPATDFQAERKIFLGLRTLLILDSCTSSHDSACKILHTAKFSLFYVDGRSLQCQDRKVVICSYLFFFGGMKSSNYFQAGERNVNHNRNRQKP